MVRRGSPEDMYARFAVIDGDEIKGVFLMKIL